MKNYFMAIAGLLFTLNVQPVNAQSFEADHTITASPDASAMARGGGVNLYTGKATISVPLYTVTSRKISIPISLSYDASGVQVAANASWVGLNWSLMAGGSVTRTVKGLPDDAANGFLTRGAEVDNYQNSWTGASAYLGHLHDGDWDAQPDIFRFNVNGTSGMFFFDTNGEIIVESLSPLKVSYTQDANNEINSFTIRTSSGMHYAFSAIERTTSDPFNYQNAIYDYESRYPGSYFQNASITADEIEYNSAWRLTKITSMNGDDQVNFQYNDVISGYLSGERHMLLNDGQLIQSMDLVYVDAKELSKITWDNGEVEFIADHDRIDLPNATDPALQTKGLTKIIVRDENLNFITGYQMTYGLFAEAIPYEGPTHVGYLSVFNYMLHRMKLQSVERIGDEQGITTLPATTFTYNETPLPPKYSAQRDYWGCFNASVDGSGNPSINLMPQLYWYPEEDGTTGPYFSQISVYPRTTFVGPEVIVPGSNRNTDPTAMQAGILERVTHPTGGFTEYTYESDQFVLDGITRKGGGCRVKTIRVSDGENTATDIYTNYSYTSSNTNESSGLVVVLPTFAFRHFGGIAPYSTSYLTCVSYSQLTPTRTQGSNVGYTEVTVSQTGQGKSVFYYNMPGSFTDVEDECDANGICVYKRAIPEIVSSSNYNDAIWGPFPFAEQPNYDWNRGLLSKTEVYNENDQLLTRTSNTYEIKNFLRARGIKSRKNFWNYYLPNNPSSTKASRYYHLGGWVALTEQKSELFDLNDPNNSVYEGTTTYDYNNIIHQNVTEIRAVDSEGRDLITRISYPADFPGSTTFGEGEGITLLRDYFNNHDVPIETTIWQNDGGGEKLVTGSITTYKNFGTATDPIVHVHKGYVFDTQEPATNVQPTVSGNLGYSQDSRYRVLGEQIAYDSYGLPQSWKIVGAPQQSLIYGHHNTAVIASVTNAEPGEIAYTGFESDDQNVWLLNSLNANSTVEPYVGSSCREIDAGSNSYGPIMRMTPTNQSGRYLFSGWVRTPIGYGTGNARLVFHSANLSDDSPYPQNTPSAYQSIVIPDTNDDWVYVEAVIDLEQIRQDAGLPPGEQLRLAAFILNTDGSYPICVDELRLHPEDAIMQTASYKDGFGLVGQTGANGQSMHLSYDVFGRTKMVENHLRQILQKTVYNFGN